MEPWPYRGTREEIAAIDAVLADLRKRGMWGNTTEWRRANFKRAMLMRQPGKLRCTEQTKESWQAAVLRNREKRAQSAEERAEKAKLALTETWARVNAPLVAKNANDILKMGPTVLAALEKSIKATTFRERKWAVEVYARLLSSLAGKQIAPEPARKVEPRKVVVRGWPAEGSKS